MEDLLRDIHDDDESPIENQVEAAMRALVSASSGIEVRRKIYGELNSCNKGVNNTVHKPQPNPRRP